MMDVDFDDLVERNEMVAWFNNNQATLCKPYYLSIRTAVM
jgi:hypothetical protein